MPVGLVEDMIACYQIMNGTEQKKTAARPLPGTPGEQERDMDDFLFDTMK